MPISTKDFTREMFGLGPEPAVDELFPYGGIDRRYPYTFLSEEELQKRREQEWQEIQDRAKEMGLLVCSCHPVENANTETGRTVIRNPNCPVHQQFDRLK